MSSSENVCAFLHAFRDKFPAETEVKTLLEIDEGRSGLNNNVNKILTCNTFS